MRHRPIQKPPSDLFGRAAPTAAAISFAAILVAVAGALSGWWETAASSAESEAPAAATADWREAALEAKVARIMREARLLGVAPAEPETRAALDERQLRWYADRAARIERDARSLSEDLTLHADRISGDDGGGTDPEPPVDPPPPPTGERWGFVREVLELRDRDVSDWNDLSGSYPGGGPHPIIGAGAPSPSQWRQEVLNAEGREHWISHGGRDFAIDVPLLWEDIEQGPWALSECGPKWGFRIYGTRAGVTIRRVWAYAFRCTTDAHWAYLSMAGGPYVFEDILLEQIGGQAFQLRSDEDKNGGLHVPTVGGEILIRRVVILDAGWQARGASPVTIWGVGRPGREFDVRLQEVWLDNSWDEPGPKGERSRGGLLIQNPEHITERTYGTVVLDRVFASLIDSDRQHLLNGADLLVVNGCHFTGSPDNKRDVIIDRRDGPYAGHLATRKVIWLGNTGPADVWLGTPKQGGSVMGGAKEDFVIEKGRRRKVTRLDIEEAEKALGHALYERPSR